MDNTTYVNHLRIRHHHKGVPYGGLPGPREDGTQNHGFKNLKGSPTGVALIPECIEDEVMGELVTALADPVVGLFTVGCASYEVLEKELHQVVGYVEFALNSRRGIADATNYFPLFFHFERMLHRSKFATPVMFMWELEAVSFFEKNADGFTCSVFVKSQMEPSKQAARMGWDAGLTALKTYLSSVPVYPDRLY